MTGRIPQSFIDDLLNRIDIVELIDRRLTLKKAGREYHACCPFHNEKTPSFTVSPSKQFYHCFGCGAHGSAISFLMEYENLDFIETLETLAHSAGVEIPREAQAQSASPSLDLYTLMQRANRLYQQALRQSKETIEYVKGRGISGQTAKIFQLGYAPDQWRFLAQLNAPPQQLLACGLQTQKADNSYDRFRARLMFPIQDRRGRCVGFGGRIIGEGEPKYLNSPETELFKKGQILYGLYEARQHNRRLERIVVVEGYMDVVSLFEQGITNAVATLGTATTPEHLKQLFRLVAKVVFCFDGDRAGRAAAWRALENTLPLLQDGLDIRFLFLPQGEDPDSFVRHHGQAAFTQRLDSATPLSDFLFDQLSDDLDLSEDAGRARFAYKLRPLLEKMPPSVYRQLLERRLSSLLGMDINAGAPAAKPTGRVRQKASSGSATRPIKRMNAMRTLIAMTLQFPALAKAVFEQNPQPIPPQEGLAVFIELLEMIIDQPTLTTANLLERYRDHPLQKALAQLATWCPSGHHAIDETFARNEISGALERLRNKTPKASLSLSERLQQQQARWPQQPGKKPS